jgi:hypothetical protein
LRRYIRNCQIRMESSLIKVMGYRINHNGEHVWMSDSIKDRQVRAGSDPKSGQN